MATFDSVLNATIPWIIAILGIYILYKPLKEPLDPLFSGIGKVLGSIKRMITGERDDDVFIEEIPTLEYE